MKGADGDRNGCSVHKGASRVSGGSIRKTGMLFFGFFFSQRSSQDRRCCRGEVGTEILEEQKKKSNAYFGKTLVRLACNQEKNKEQKNQIEKWNPKNETNCKKKQLTVPTEELNSLYQMVCIIIMACSSSSSSSSEERDGVHSVTWRNENDLKNPTEISGDGWGKAKKGNGVWWLVSSVRIPDFQRFKFACDEKCWWELRSKKEKASTLESYTENMLSARNPNLWFETIVYILYLSM